MNARHRFLPVHGPYFFFFTTGGSATTGAGGAAASTFRCARNVSSIVGLGFIHASVFRNNFYAIFREERPLPIYHLALTNYFA